MGYKMNGVELKFEY